jgi:CDP-diglyceride synthetase
LKIFDIVATIVRSREKHHDPCYRYHCYCSVADAACVHNKFECCVLAGDYVTLPSFGIFPFFLVTLFCLSAGAMLGDLLGSFIKRRVGLKRGAPFPLVDQLDFVAGAWLLLFLFAREWFTESFSLAIILAVIIITPLLHLLTNYIGFKIGKKQVPW